MVTLPQTFGYMNCEVRIVDVALEKWFGYMTWKLQTPASDQSKGEQLSSDDEYSITKLVGKT